jgi:hypothetical protein
MQNPTWKRKQQLKREKCSISQGAEYGNQTMKPKEPILDRSAAGEYLHQQLQHGCAGSGSLATGIPL